MSKCSKRAIEDYLKTLFEKGGDRRYIRTTEVATRLNIKPPSVTEMFRRLHELDLVDYKPGIGARLKAKGFRQALQIQRKNLLIQRFLEEILGLSRKESKMEACKLEHVLSDKVIVAMEQMLSSKQPVEILSENRNP
ncbi:MAG: metal-dependent transcriptional regulator [Thermoproteota archaeon]|nr:MAG: metal-dependent transcriptional regulator [Candidatus Korarchaeota archaeon]RLG54848.1 MAG: metal-dependent transcriptional regulator [Candidatus Korarchaeota archaeon]